MKTVSIIIFLLIVFVVIMRTITFTLIAQRLKKDKKAWQAFKDNLYSGIRLMENVSIPLHFAFYFSLNFFSFKIDNTLIDNKSEKFIFIFNLLLIAYVGLTAAICIIIVVNENW